jgi:hypothetical protein
MGKALVNKNMPVNPACFLVVQNTACLVENGNCSLPVGILYPKTVSTLASKLAFAG